jgi:hypothetical protein
MMPAPGAEDAAEPVDAFDAATRRDSRAGAGVDVIVLDEGHPQRAESIGEQLVALVRSLNRPATLQTLRTRDDRGLGRALESALAASSLPLVLITSAVEPWTAAHLAPLHDAIERADHVIGRRPASGWQAARLRLDTFIRTLVFAVPIRDIHSPCRLHRREAIAAIPLQSESRFVEVEILAKANFLTQLLSEVDVPALAFGEDPRRHGLYRIDRRDILWKPRLAREPVSGPAEDAKREEEGADRPGPQDEESRGDGAEPRALEDHSSQGARELREG